MNKKQKSQKYMGSVKVGPKGQIVIPKKVREMFDINPGDTLLILADSEQGIAMQHLSIFDKIADAIFAGNAKQLYPDHSESESLDFAKAIKQQGEQE